MLGASGTVTVGGVPRRRPCRGAEGQGQQAVGGQAWGTKSLGSWGVHLQMCLVRL